MLYSDELLHEISLRPQVVVVTGGRDYHPPVEMLLEVFRPWQVPSQYRAERYLPELVVLNGLARGVDSAVDVFCDVREISKQTFPAKWETVDEKTGSVTKHPRAGFDRNQVMVDLASICLAFPGGGGTADCRERALLRGLLVIDVGESDD